MGSQATYMEELQAEEKDARRDARQIALQVKNIHGDERGGQTWLKMKMKMTEQKPRMMSNAIKRIHGTRNH
jgi:hypothetical protein